MPNEMMKAYNSHKHYIMRFGEIARNPCQEICNQQVNGSSPFVGFSKNKASEVIAKAFFHSC